MRCALTVFTRGLVCELEWGHWPGSRHRDGAVSWAGWPGEVAREFTTEEEATQ